MAITWQWLYLSSLASGRLYSVVFSSDLHHERRVSKDEREQRRDDRRLALAHQHLVADGAAAEGRLDQLAHQLHLRAREGRLMTA